MPKSKLKRRDVIMTQEVIGVARELHRRILQAHRKGYTKCPSLRTRLVIFRLLTGFGMRPGEVASLTMGDARLGCGYEDPLIYIQADNAKNGTSREIPAWDHRSRDDVISFKEFRISQGARDKDPFIISQRPPRIAFGNVKTRKGAWVSTQHVYAVWKRCIRLAVSEERAKVLEPTAGRRFFISYMLAKGIPLADVQAAAGHNSLEMTAQYCRLKPWYGGRVPGGDLISEEGLEKLLQKSEADEGSAATAAASGRGEPR